MDLTTAIHDVLVAFLAATALTIIFQVVAICVAVVLLARFQAPPIAYKLLGTVAVLGIGFFMAATPAGWTLFSIECVLGVLGLMVNNGYSATRPHVRAMAVDQRGHPIVIEAKQPFFGPSKDGPKADSMLDSVADTVERLSGERRALEGLRVRLPETPTNEYDWPVE